MILATTAELQSSLLRSPSHDGRNTFSGSNLCEWPDQSSEVSVQLPESWGTLYDSADICVHHQETFECKIQSLFGRTFEF